MGLGMVSGTAGRRNGFRSIQKHTQHQWEGVEEMQFGSSHVHGRRVKPEAQMKHGMLRLEIRRSLFPRRTTQQQRQGLGKVGSL